MNENALHGAFALYDTQYEDACITQITPSISHVIRSLPKINRFNGHTSLPYNVAAHSVQCVIAAQEVYGYTKPHQLLAVLMHDAVEAYISDIPRPIKRAFFRELLSIEHTLFNKFMNSVFKIHPVHWEEIQSNVFQENLAELDLRMACTEYDFLGETKLLPEVPRLKLKKGALITDWRKSTYEFCSALNRLTSSTLTEAPRFSDTNDFVTAARNIISGVRGSDTYFL